MATTSKPLAVLAAIALAASVLTAVSVSQPDPAAASTGNIRTPFGDTKPVHIYQGYGPAYSHKNQHLYGLDLTYSSNMTSTTGRTVVAPEAGTVTDWESATGTVCVTTPSNRSYALTHIESTFRTGAKLTAGQKVGTVAAPNNKGAGPVAHLHFQYWSGGTCYPKPAKVGDPFNPGIPFSTANKLRICGAKDLPPGGTGTNGQYSGYTFTASVCGKAFTTAPTPKIKAEALGTRLGVTVGTWSPTPTSISRLWLRNGASTGVTASTYTPTSADLHKFITVRTTASLAGYATTSKTSAKWRIAQVTLASGYSYVNVRSSPSTSATIVGQLQRGKYVALDCFNYGTSVKGPYSTSTIWYRITGIGWVSDALLETNSNSPVTHRC